MSRTITVTQRNNDGKELTMEVDVRTTDIDDPDYAKHVNCSLKDIVESFKDLCNSMEWN